jgi:hypothetical protein
MDRDNAFEPSVQERIPFGGIELVFEKRFDGKTEKLFVSIEKDGVIVDSPKGYSLNAFEIENQLGKIRNRVSKHLEKEQKNDLEKVFSEVIARHYEHLKGLSSAPIPDELMPEKKKKIYIITDIRRERALRFLEKEDVLSFYLKVLKKSHIGDDAVKVAALLSRCSAYIDSGEIHLWLVGGSGKGKKLLGKIVIYFPEHKCKVWASLSPTTIKYFGEENDLWGFLHHFDEGKIIGEAIGFLRSLTSGSDFGGIPRDIGFVREQKYIGTKIDPKQIVWISSVHTLEDEDNQLPNRFFIMNVDESTAQDKIVHAFQKDVLGSGEECDVPSEDIELIKDILYVLSGEDSKEVTKVIIPYIRHIDYTDTHDRRMFPLFCKFIKASAKLHEYQRMKAEDNSILAGYEDYLVARYLWDRFYETQILKVSEKAAMIYYFLGTENEKKTVSN